MTNLWNLEDPITDYLPEFDIPHWIESNISPNDVAAICEGGCASGAYMPAVTYHQAIKTMSEHGDDVLQYIQDSLGILPQPKPDESWSGMACFYLSCAVEIWASDAELKLENDLPDEEAA